MILRAIHTTTYLYSEPVSICHTEAHLTPRQHWGQAVLEHELTIIPTPDFSLTRQDYFGNEAAYFSLHEPHQNLSITARSLVDVHDSQLPEPDLTPGWEQVREDVRRAATEEAFRASEFVFESPRVGLGPEPAAYGAESFRPGRPILNAVM